MVREALRALADSEPRLVRIGPPGAHEDAPPGVVCAESTCASEGVVEVLVEPQLPAPLVVVVGDGPAARTLAELARTIGWRVANELVESADAVVVATMGTRRTGGYSIEIRNVAPTDKTLRISLKQTSPPPDAITVQALTAPFHFVAVPKSDLKPEFVEAPDQKK